MPDMVESRKQVAAGKVQQAKNDTAATNGEETGAPPVGGYMSYFT